MILNGVFRKHASEVLPVYSTLSILWPQYFGIFPYQWTPQYIARFPCTNKRHWMIYILWLSRELCIFHRISLRRLKGVIKNNLICFCCHRHSAFNYVTQDCSLEYPPVSKYMTRLLFNLDQGNTLKTKNSRPAGNDTKLGTEGTRKRRL